MDECCEKHTEELHRHIQHMIEQYKRSVGGGHHWNLPEQLTCKHIDAILDHVSRSAIHGANHPIVPLIWENNRTPNLSCKVCSKGILTFAVEDAYCEIVIGYSPYKKTQPPVIRRGL